MTVVLLPLLLTAVVLVAVGRAAARAAEEAAELRVVLARVNDLRPDAMAVAEGVRRLRSGIDRLGR